MMASKRKTDSDAWRMDWLRVGLLVLAESVGFPEAAGSTGVPGGRGGWFRAVADANQADLVGLAGALTFA